MSRVGKLPIKLEAGVKATLTNGILSVTGKQGVLTKSIPSEVLLELNESQITVQPTSKSQRSRAFWGLYRSLINGMVTGVSKGFSKTLEINGVGFRASVTGKYLNLFLGYSHEIKVLIPKDVKVVAEKPTLLQISGFNKELVGEFAARVRKLRLPEPYKGKGVKYSDERIVMKEGKKK